MKKRNRVLSILLCLGMLLSVLTGRTGSVFAVSVEDIVNENPTRSITNDPLIFYFDHYYHADSFGLSKRQYIFNAVTFVNFVYQPIFEQEGVNASFTSSGIMNEETVTDIDDCSLGCDSPCAMTSICGDRTRHHKDIGIIANQLYNGISRQEDHITVLWTDLGAGVYCYYQPTYDGLGNVTGYVHDYVDYCGFVLGYRPVIHIMDLQYASTTSQYCARMSLLLAHETMHTFGIDDSYEEIDKHMYNNTRECIMDYAEISENTDVEFYRSVLLEDEDAFCSYCEDCIGGVILNFL